MQVKYIEDPITKVQSYKLKKYYGKDMNEKRCRNGKAIWNVTKGTEERFLEKCKEDEQQLGFLVFDCCDIGDEARLSLCFCKNKQENFQNILEGV